MSHPPVIDRFAGEYHFLSSFAAYPVSFLGVVWPTREHAFQAAKCVDPAQRTLVAAVETPGAAKRVGQVVRCRPDWKTVRVGIMRTIIARQVTSHPDLVQLLVDTGDARLVEGNTWHDQFWGDCRCGRPACQTPGLNHLGLLWEKQRDSSLLGNIGWGAL